MPYVGADKLLSATAEPDTKYQPTAPTPPEGMLCVAFHCTIIQKNTKLFTNSGTVPLVNIKEKDTTRLASKESLTVSGI